MSRVVSPAAGPILPRVLDGQRAERLGITRGRVRGELSRGNWRRLCPGLVLTRPEHPTRRDLAEAGLLLAGAGSAVSGWDAARCYGVGPEQPMSATVLVLSPQGNNRMVSGIRIRPTARAFDRRASLNRGTSMRGFPVAGPSRAVADAALQCQDLPSARGMLIAAVQRGLCTAASLLAEYELGPRNGSYFLRRAVQDVLDGARSVAEAEASQILVEAALPAFELNVPVCDVAGRVRFVVDVLWRSLRAVLEIDSRAHHGNEPDRLATMARHNRLAAAGLVVVHWAPTTIRSDPHAFAQQVGDWLVGRAAELGTTLPPGTGPIRPSEGESPPPFLVRGL